MDCAGSHLRGSCIGPANLRCGNCGALRYCSRKHQKAHWLEHAESCERMAEQMQRAPILYDFPFSFTTQTLNVMDADENTICSFLERMALHGQGLWQPECKCFPPRALLPHSQGIAEMDRGWSLSSNLCPCTGPLKSAGSVKDWLEYYVWRGLPLDSPVSLILHWPLSMYYALCLLQSQSNSNLLTGRSKNLVIHYLVQEIIHWSQNLPLQIAISIVASMSVMSHKHLQVPRPERELDQLPVFGELLALLPSKNIHIEFVGPAVPDMRDGEVLKLESFAKCTDSGCTCKSEVSCSNREIVTSDTHGGIYVKLWKGLYHNRHSELGATPDLIFAANAGIAAFPSWQPTIELIGRLQVPAFFTDYCEEAGVMAGQAIAFFTTSPLTFPVQVNPFRQPLTPSNKVLDLPMCSNAFIFGMN